MTPLNQHSQPQWLTAEPDLDRPPSKVEARLQKQVLKLVRTLESLETMQAIDVLPASAIREDQNPA